MKLIQRIGKPGLTPAYMLDKEASVKVEPRPVKTAPTCGVALASYKQQYYNREVRCRPPRARLRLSLSLSHACVASSPCTCTWQVSVVEMDGKLEDIKDFVHIDKMIAETAAKVPGELSSEIIKVGANSPGALDGTGLFQTLTALKLREYYESVTGKKVSA